MNNTIITITKFAYHRSSPSTIAKRADHLKADITFPLPTAARIIQAHGVYTRRYIPTLRIHHSIDTGRFTISRRPRRKPQWLCADSSGVRSHLETAERGVRTRRVTDAADAKRVSFELAATGRLRGRMLVGKFRSRGEEFFNVILLAPPAVW